MSKYDKEQVSVVGAISVAKPCAQFRVSWKAGLRPVFFTTESSSPGCGFLRALSVAGPHFSEKPPGRFVVGIVFNRFAERGLGGPRLTSLILATARFIRAAVKAGFHVTASCHNAPTTNRPGSREPVVYPIAKLSLHLRRCIHAWCKMCATRNALDGVFDIWLVGPRVTGSAVRIEPRLSPPDTASSSRTASSEWMMSAFGVYTVLTLTLDSQELRFLTRQVDEFILVMEFMSRKDPAVDH